LKLQEVKSALRPAAVAVLEQGLNYHQAGRALFLTMMEIALERTNGNQAQAAAILGCTPTYVCAVLKGRERRGRRAGQVTHPRKPFAERHGSPPADLLGGIEL
jgi:hypothetical protein